MRPILFVLLMALPLSAASAQAPGFLFVSSEPMNATVVLDGVVQQETTPLFLRDVAPGPHSLEISIEGRVTQTVEVEVPSQAAIAVSVLLSPRGVVASFPYQDEMIVGGKPIAVSDKQVRMEGPHTVEWAENEGLIVEPVLPEQKVIDALNIAIPVFLVFTGVITAEAVANPQDIDWPLPPAVLASQVISVGLIATDVVFYIKKRRRLENYREPFLATSPEAQVFLAEQQLAEGKRAEARATYRAIIENHPESLAHPRALYRLASMDALEGNVDNALGLYARICEEFPLPELYDRANKAAADILFSQGRHKESLTQLDRMVFWDPFYSRDEVMAYRKQIEAARDAVSAP